MDRSGPPPSHEAEPLTNLNFQPRVSAEDSELRNHSYCYASRPPSPSLSSATDYSAESEGVPPTNTPADNQEQQHVETHHEKDQDPSHQIKNLQKRQKFTETVVVGALEHRSCSASSGGHSDHIGSSREASPSKMATINYDKRIHRCIHGYFQGMSNYAYR